MVKGHYIEHRRLRFTIWFSPSYLKALDQSDLNINFSQSQNHHHNHTVSIFAAAMSLFLTMGFVHCRHLISTLCCFWSNKVVAAAKSPGCMQMELNPELIADIDKKPLAEVVNGGGAIKAAAAHKKHYDPPKPDTVIVISTNEELESEEKKPVAVIARKSRVRFSRMPHKTRPMTALFLFTGLNVILVSTITSVYDCLLSSILGQKGMFPIFMFWANKILHAL